ncbi:MAG TPA: DUF503 domain-containing protein [Phycisphaerae bacterium]|nr:DUF503 domain-containing protein [Phycisphaerae bacterium]
MATVVGLLHLELHVPEAMTLKDKRRIVKGFKDRLRNHNVSVAEVGALDSCRRAVLAVSMVGNERPYVEGALQQILNSAARHRDMVLVSEEWQWL